MLAGLLGSQDTQHSNPSLLHETLKKRRGVHAGACEIWIHNALVDASCLSIYVHTREENKICTRETDHVGNCEELLKLSGASSHIKERHAAGRPDLGSS